MTEHITFFVILLMAGALCARLWTMQPAETMKQVQEDRIDKVATLIFH